MFDFLVQTLGATSPERKEGPGVRGGMTSLQRTMKKHADGMRKLAGHCQCSPLSRKLMSTCGSLSSSGCRVVAAGLFNPPLDWFVRHVVISHDCGCLHALGFRWTLMSGLNDFCNDYHPTRQVPF